MNHKQATGHKNDAWKEEINNIVWFQAEKTFLAVSHTHQEAICLSIIIIIYDKWSEL